MFERKYSDISPSKPSFCKEVDDKRSKPASKKIFYENQYGGDTIQYNNYESNNLQTDQSLTHSQNFSNSRPYTHQSFYQESAERLQGKKHFESIQNDHIANLSELITKKSEDDRMKNSRTPDKSRDTLDVVDKKCSIRTYQAKYSHETNLAQLISKTSADGFAYHRRVNTSLRNELDNRSQQHQQIDIDKLQYKKTQNEKQRPPRNPVTGYGFIAEKKEGIGIVNQDRSKTPEVNKIFSSGEQQDTDTIDTSFTRIKRNSKTYISNIPYISRNQQNCDLIEVNHKKQTANQKCQASPQIKRILTECSNNMDFESELNANSIQQKSQIIKPAKKFEPSMQSSEYVKVLMNELNPQQMTKLSQDRFVKQSNKLLNERKNESYNVKKLFSFGEGVNIMNYDDYIRSMKANSQQQQSQQQQHQYQTGKKKFTSNIQNTSEQLRGAFNQLQNQNDQSNIYNENKKSISSNKKDASLIISKNNQNYSKTVKQRWKN